jgi:hypothetical protein
LGLGWAELSLPNDINNEQMIDVKSLTSVSIVFGEPRALQAENAADWLDLNGKPQKIQGIVGHEQFGSWPNSGASRIDF